jgi:hypothetical protein
MSETPTGRKPYVDLTDSTTSAVREAAVGAKDAKTLAESAMAEVGKMQRLRPYWIETLSIWIPLGFEG